MSRFLAENWLALLVVAALAAGYMSLRSSPTTIASVEEFAASLEQGQPTVVEFYSNT